MTHTKHDLESFFWLAFFFTLMQPSTEPNQPYKVPCKLISHSSRDTPAAAPGCAAAARRAGVVRPARTWITWNSSNANFREDFWHSDPTRFRSQNHGFGKKKLVKTFTACQILPWQLLHGDPRKTTAFEKHRDLNHLAFVFALKCRQTTFEQHWASSIQSPAARAREPLKHPLAWLSPHDAASVPERIQFT